MDLLAALQSFVRVAETGSFTAVSRATGQSQPTVSRQIAMLEQHFDVRLFNRTTRSLTVTADGQTLLAHARQMLETLDTAEDALGRRQAQPRGLVRLGTTTAFGLFLTPRIGSLLDRYPELSVELVMRDSFGDMIEEGLDLAVRINLPSESTLLTRRLADMPRPLVAAPTYLERHGVPAEPDDLTGHACVVYTYGIERHVWHFARGTERRSIQAAGGFRANNSEAVHQAALHGLGIALLPAYQVREDISAGRLRVLMPDWMAEPLMLHVAYPGPRHLPLRTRTVLDFLTRLPFG